ncbi:Adenylate kinase 2 [Stygiomarasmius scandens]|uniref:Adenylate kinase 2 n=1 Tax=Marasmiellus scandens TaxID=2682957 RepID=A0ABR1JTJ8_9AGAR
MNVLRTVCQTPVAGPSSVRFISNSNSSQKALPFFLNTLRGARQDSEHENDHRHGRMLRMLMFGKPGAGKGTLSTRLVKKYDIVSLSTGDLLRQHILEKTDVGLQAEGIVAQGGLVPDELMLKVVTSKLDLLHDKHWILDGFPRTLAQGQMLDKHLGKQHIPLSLVVNIDVPDEIILGRISDRWVHLPSGRVYNMSYNRPKVEGLDDETGEPLTKRPDDNPEIFSRRLEKYYSITEPLLSYYANSSQKPIPSLPHRNPHQHPHQLAFHTRPPHRLALQTLTGTTSDEIWPKLEAVVQGAFPGLKQRAESAEEKRRHSLSDAIAAGTSQDSVETGQK